MTQAAIEARLFDGRTARAQPVRLSVQGDALRATGEDGSGQSWPLRDLQWPETTRHGRRVIQLRGSGSIECDDAAAFDAWRSALGQRDSWVVRAQQHWRATLTALALLLGVAAAGYVWGVPWAADRVVALLPAPAEAAIGDAALASLRDGLLGPTTTPMARQAALRDSFARAVAAAYPEQERVPWQLHFHSGGKRLGANALALPGGHIVITDEMLALLQGQDDTVIGVLSHEYGHVRLRHGMRAVVRATLISAASTLALGDVSGLLAAAPAVLAHLGYSRDAEREADAEAVLMLRASGVSPAVMVLLFERLAAQPEGARADSLPIALASHPADAERIAFFRDAAAGR